MIAERESSAAPPVPPFLQTAEDITAAENEAHIARVIEQYKQYINPGLGRLMQFAGFGDVEETAEGCIVRTASGKEYLDFVGGFGVFSLGHRHPRVIEAVRRQLERMPLSTRTFFSGPQAALAERLAEVTPGDLRYTFYSNSGAEAVEAALKFARIATGRTDFVSTLGAYHGKTMGSLSATGREKYRLPFGPLVPGFSHVPFDDIGAMADAVTDKTAAVIIEPIQGEGGIITPAPGYLTALRRLCDERGALLIADEVQTGLARTGAMFGVNHDGITPDLLCLAKALGGGVMPIGATIATQSIWERAFQENPLIHTSTFGGNQLACAAGLETLAVIEDEGLIEKAQVRGEQLMAGLRTVQRELPQAIAAVRGQGLMLGVEFAVKDVAEIAINMMAGSGIIAAYTLNNPKVIRMEPPLIVSEAQIETFLHVFQDSVTTAVAMLDDLDDLDA